MKTSKRMLRVIMVLALVLAIVGTTAGCVNKPSGVIQLDQESYTHEYGEIFMVPFATCTNGEEVTVQIFDADGFEVPVEYGTATLEKGEYKMVFTAGDVTKEVPVSCVDTTAPQLFISYTSSAAVGHWYELPAVTAEDLSGLDSSKTTIALYKAGEETPVLTVPGDRVRIEAAEYYTLKAVAVDTEGNEAVFEKKIEVIERPESEVLQDFSQEPNAFHENTFGGGAPLFKWYEEYDGKEGVIALGAADLSAGDWPYIWWTNLGMDHLDLVGATGFTFKVKAENNRSLAIKPSFSGESLEVCKSTDGWVEIYVSLVNADGVFADMSDATIGLFIAPAEKTTGEVVWVDEIIVHYTPYTEHTVTVEDGTLDYPYELVPLGREVIVTHDDSKTPEGKAFSHYEYNGERLWGGAFTVTEDATLTAVYVDLVAEEKPIPEGATLVTDFSNAGMVVVDENWGSNNMDISEWYATYDGVAGVRSMGFMANNEHCYHRWSGILPAYFDYTGYTHITFRVKVDKSHVRALVVGDTNLYDLTEIEDMVWTDVKVPISKIDNFGMMWIANTQGASGELVWLDAIYVTTEDFDIAITDGTVDCENNKAPYGATVTFTHDASKTPADCEFNGWIVNGVKIEGNTYVIDGEITVKASYKATIPELVIPENSVLITDFSDAVVPYIPGNWGSGEPGAYYNSYGVKDGRAGVFAMGANGECFMWYTMSDLGGIDLTGMDTITFRLKVKGSIRTLQIKHDEIEEFDLLQYVTVKDEWTEVTVKIADLGYSEAALSNASIQFRFATWNEGETEYVLFDQVYATPDDGYEEAEELAIPAGAKLITDFSKPVTPHIPDHWGSGSAAGYYNTYKEVDGRAGVFAMGAKGESFMWYNAIGLNDMDLTGYETITFRLKVKGSIRTLQIKHDEISEYDLLSHVTVRDEWTEVTINIADLGYSDLSKATIQFRFATWNEGDQEYVWFDQVYVQ